MGSAILNYHARDAACEQCGAQYGPSESQRLDYECGECGEDLYIIANETDVGNIITCRNTLLATTHGLTEKKMAVLDAIRARGGQANPSGTAVQATKQDIISEIQQNDDIATLTKSEVNQILEELDEHLIINIKDNPEDRRENLYVYDGSDVFKPPNIFDYYERFSDVVDPIHEQPIEKTVDQQLEELNAKMDTESMARHSDSTDDESGSLGDFGDDDAVDLTDDAEAVVSRVSDVLDGYTIPSDVMEANSLKLSHMVGDTPVDYDGNEVRPQREPSGSDRVDGFMEPTDAFDDAANFNEVEDRVGAAIEELQSSGVMSMTANDDGSVDVAVDY